jgi:hypothetical protein
VFGRCRVQISARGLANQTDASSILPQSPDPRLECGLMHAWTVSFFCISTSPIRNTRGCLIFCCKIHVADVVLLNKQKKQQYRMRSTVFWVEMPCTWETAWSFAGTSRLHLPELQRVTTYKTLLFIVTAVRTSNAKIPQEYCGRNRSRQTIFTTEAIQSVHKFYGVIYTNNGTYAASHCSRNTWAVQWYCGVQVGCNV